MIENILKLLSDFTNEAHQAALAKCRELKFDLNSGVVSLDESYINLIYSCNTIKEAIDEKRLIRLPITIQLELIKSLKTISSSHNKLLSGTDSIKMLAEAIEKLYTDIWRYGLNHHSNKFLDYQAKLNQLKDIVGNIFSVLWKTVLIIGGILLLMYLWSIQYFPILDLSSATALLAAISITGIGLISLLALYLVLPGILWWVGMDAFKATRHKYLFACVLSGLVFLITTLYLILLFAKKFEQSNPEKMVLSWIILIVMTGLAFFVNYLVARNLSKKKDGWFIPAVAISLVFICLLAFGQLQLLPYYLVSLLKVGGIENAQLVLDQQGCQIAHQLKLIPALEVPTVSSVPTVTTKKPKVNAIEKNSLPENCTIQSVTILSRIGQEYYLEKTDKSFHFAIPSSHVLSWSVTNDKAK